MGIFKKLADLARFNINAFLDQIEDKQKLANQAVLDLKASKKKAETLLISAMAALKLAESKQSTLRTKVTELLERAEHALKENQEEEAKTVLTKKQNIVDLLEVLSSQIDKERSTIVTLNEGLRALDKKINLYKTQAAVALGHEEIAKEDAFLTFARMEEKIEMAENEVEAMNELLAMTEQRPTPSEHEVKQFDKHSDPEALAKEIAAIKRKLNQ